MFVAIGLCCAKEFLQKNMLPFDSGNHKWRAFFIQFYLDNLFSVIYGKYKDYKFMVEISYMIHAA